MAKPTNGLFLFLLVVLVFVNIVSAEDSAVSGSFIECLTKMSVPSDVVYSPGSPSFPTVLQNYIRNKRFNISSTPKPLLIVTPTDYSHVQAAVVCSKSLGMQMKIRSGGHDYEGISYVSDVPGFFILDMFNFRSVDVDVANEIATVQTGAILGEVYYKIWESSKTHCFPAGVCPTVGVGGHLSGGGYGNLMRKYGLSSDNIVDARIVDATGRILDRKSMGEDLFWAIRGGGGASFAVILSYTIKILPVPAKVTVFRIEKTLDQNATDMVYQFQRVASVTDDDLFMRLLLQPVSSKTQKGKKTVRASVLALFLGDSDRLLTITGNDFPELGLKKQDCREMSWIESVLYWGNFDVNTTSPSVLLDRNLNSAGFLKRKSDYVQSPMSKAGLEFIFKKMIELGKAGMVFNSYGGKMSELSSTETPFPHRAGNMFKIQYSVNWDEDSANATREYLTQARRLYSYMTPFVSNNPRSAYLNYRDLDIGVNDHGKQSLEEGEVYGKKYFGQNYDRLVEIKTMVDPHNFFRNEQSIPSSAIN